MGVAKRQRREKPVKIEQRKVRGLEWEPQVKQTSWLTQFTIYIRQAQEQEKKKHIKRGAKIGLGASLLFGLWVGPPSCLEDVFSFACQ